MRSLLPSLFWWQWLLLASAGIVIYIAIVSAYRLTLHPLAKYPGPFLAKLTDWVLVYHTSTGDRHLDLLKSHEKYGPIVRIGPNTLSFNTVGAVKEIYANRKGNVRKASWYGIIEASAGADSIHAEIDRSVHASHRRIVEHGFTEKALRSAEIFIVSNINTLCDIIEKSPKTATTREEDKHDEWSQPFNFSQWATYLNYDIMGDLVFGRRFNCMTSDEHRFVPGLLMNSTAFVYTFASIPLKHILRPILASGILSLPIIGGNLARDDKKFYNYAERILDERIAAEEKLRNKDDPNERKDMMHYILQATDPQTGKGFSQQQLKAESGLLIAAGADTTALTLAAAVFYLLHNPRVLDVLLAEVRQVPSGADGVSMSKLLNLPYLRAVIDETLRLSPPAGSVLPREVLQGGLTIGSEHIPEGTVVGVSAYVIHRNPEYYPEPSTFYPERWIIGRYPGSEVSQSIARTPAAVQAARQVFSPFSQGARGCIGRQLAYYELHTALAVLLRRFDIRLAKDAQTGTMVKNSTAWRNGVTPVLDPEDQDETWREERKRKGDFQLFDHFLSDRNGPMVEFRRRAT